MAEKFQISVEYYRLAKKVIQEHKDLSNLSDYGVRIRFLESDAEKKERGKTIYGKCIKVPLMYRLFTQSEYIIVIYTPNVEYFTTDQKKTLLYHELLHIDIDPDPAGGVRSYGIRPHDTEEFREVLELYGPDWADRPHREEEAGEPGDQIPGQMDITDAFDNWKAEDPSGLYDGSEEEDVYGTS